MTRRKGVPDKLIACRPIPAEVRDEIRQKIAKRFPDANPHVCWNMGGKIRTHKPLSTSAGVFGAHRASYFAYHGEIPYGMVIGHKCDNPRCVNPHHLEAITMAQNTKDACDRFRMFPCRGETNGSAKLTRETALACIEECKRTGDGYRRIAKRLNLPPSAVKDLLSGRSWQHLTGGKRVNPENRTHWNSHCHRRQLLTGAPS